MRRKALFVRFVCLPACIVLIAAWVLSLFAELCIVAPSSRWTYSMALLRIESFAGTASQRASLPAELFQEFGERRVYIRWIAPRDSDRWVYEGWSNNWGFRSF